MNNTEPAKVFIPTAGQSANAVHNQYSGAMRNTGRFKKRKVAPACPKTSRFV
jgi:hypothetical protein